MTVGVVSVPIVILAPRVTDDSRAMWKCCLELGWRVQRFSGWRVPDGLVGDDEPVIIYGEPLFAEAVADQLGVALLEPVVTWLPSVSRDYTKRRIELMTLAEARREKSAQFVKPADGKVFDPKVYSSGAELPTDENVDGGLQVLVSDIVDYRLEVRSFVCDRELVTMSPYWRNDALAQDSDGAWPFLEKEEAEARAFIETILADQSVKLPPACTLDVGKMADGEWSIIEANPAWGAGLYGCEPMKVLPCLQPCFVKVDALSDGQAKWVSLRRDV